MIILIHFTKYSEDGAEDLLYEDMTKLTLPRLFKQGREGSPISTHFQTGVRFSSWSRTLKLTSLLNIAGQRVPSIWSSDPPGEMCTCYQQIYTPHLTMSSTERRTSGACTLGLLLIFSVHIWDYMVAYLKILSFYLSINTLFYYFIIYSLWFVPNYSVSK